MAKGKTSEKTRAVLDYLARFPDVSPKDLAERIRNETDFKKVSNDDVSKIKSTYRSQLKPQGQPEPGPQAVPTPRPVAEAVRPAPAANGPTRSQPGVAETVRLVHRLLAGVGPREAREVVDVVASMGQDEAHRLIDIVEQIGEGQEGARESRA